MSCLDNNLSRFNSTRSIPRSDCNSPYISMQAGPKNWLCIKTTSSWLVYNFLCSRHVFITKIVRRNYILIPAASYLRNRKHSPCFYRVIETLVKVWENEKCCGNTSHRLVFPQLFRVLPNFHECFYNSIETRRTCLPFLLENTVTKKNENNLLTLTIKM